MLLKVLIIIFIICSSCQILDKKNKTSYKKVKFSLEENKSKRQLDKFTDSDNFLLVSGDDIKINIYKEGKKILNKNYTVDQDGFITIEDEKIEVTDLNIEHLYTKLESIYRMKSKDFDAMCKIYIPKVKDKEVIYLRGAVKNPGLVVIKSKMNLIDIITESGGLSEDADIENIDISTKGLNESKVDKNFKIKAGDHIFINRKINL